MIANRLSPENSGRRRSKAAQRGIEKTLEYLRDMETCELTVAELCRISSISARTLEYAFRDMFGLTPKAFIRRKRFHTVRANLLTADPYETTVTAIATDHGIRHLGRFAVEYREMFGESPSQTLQCFVRNPTQRLVMDPAEPK